MLKKIDLQKQNRKNKQNFKKFLPFLIGLGMVFLIIFIWAQTTSSSSSFIFKIPLLPGASPIKSDNDRVNILMIGNAGGGHDGPLLTDSIIIASYNLKTKKAILFSIPRDLWIDKASVKVNTLYAIGVKKGDGLNYTKSKIGEIMGIPIHYAIRLDFSGFAKAIDLIEGVKVNVPHTFDDYNYPIEGKEDELCDYKEEERELKDEDIQKLNLATPYPSGLWYSDKPYPLASGKYKILLDPTGAIATDSNKIRFDCRFEHIHFDEGSTKMDGETALKFVRSRMGSNGEGSDFARSRRQQLIIQAFREKVLSLETLANPIKVTGLVATLGSSLETDIPFEHYLEFYKLIKTTKKVESVVLGDLGEGKSILVTPPAAFYGGAFVLIPQDNDMKKIHNFVRMSFSKTEDQK
ncbi:LCP family protein [Candidatus Daviesbacteria bacterium]|nr:LCP family protein [Candidatus Daviesbacteria bacterium]